MLRNLEMAGLFLLLLFIFLAVACTSPEPPAEETAPTVPEVSLSLGDLVDSLGNFQSVKDSQGQAFLQAQGANQWLAFEVEIPVAGRYRVTLRGANGLGQEAACWIEDYADNPDGRTYNITGAMNLSPQTFPQQVEEVHKDGSPMNAGKHLIRVHFQMAGLAFHSLKFDLLLEHRPSDEILTQEMDGEEWNLVWSDEFDGQGLPDTSKWTFDLGDWGWGNNELQYYTAYQLKNARQEDGHLLIEAHKEDGGHAWTSARLTTRGKVAFRYGKIEFRAKVPVERGNWAAGWTLGNSYVDEKSWPYCGEIDILETVGFELDDVTGDGKAHASVHCGAYYFKIGNQRTAETAVANMHDAFHTYGIIWTPERIEAYVDDQPYFEYADTSTELAWPFDEAQNLILNLAMGGGWGGAQGLDSTITKQQYVLDYVRVYARQ